MKDGEMTWVRNYYISQENAVTRINQNDTDAVFFQINDLPFCQSMENFSENFTKMETDFANQLKTNLNGSSILKMACEEIIVALFTSYSKKSYMRLDAVDYKDGDRMIQFRDHYAETIKQITVDGKIQLDLLKEAQK